MFAIAGGINLLIEKITSDVEVGSDKELMVDTLQMIILILTIFICFALRYAYMNMTNVL